MDLFGGIHILSEKVRLEPDGTYITLSPITVPEKVPLDPEGMKDDEGPEGRGQKVTVDQG